MVLRLVSLVVLLALIGMGAASVRSRLTSTHTDERETPEVLLRETAVLVEQVHQLTGVYAGVGLGADSALQLVSSDEAGYCLQLAWLNRVYHLRGPGGKPAPGRC
ncbi:MAG TPA: hypothetical protein VGQ68_04460 [Gaiellaceae bacterium]|nr:hypothetical protein [Gaiellaceae bacterium]